METKSYKDLIVWQKSIMLVREIYKATQSFPKSEVYGIVDQMHRASVSIPSSIAEGAGRNTRKELSRFYSISYGSALELETQLIIAQELQLASKELLKPCFELLEEVSKMLRVMISKLSPRT